MSDEYLNAHKHLLAFDKVSFSSEAEHKKFDALLGGILSTKYNLLESPLLKPIFSVNPPNFATAPEGLTYKILVNNEVSSITDAIEEENQIQTVSDLISAAVFALQLFLQTNFTGPGADAGIYQKTVKVDAENEKKFNEHCVELLSVDGEPAYTLTSRPHLLLIAIIILQNVIKHEKLENSPLISYAKWWLSRSFIIQQSLLDNLTSSLHNEVFEGYSTDNLKSVLGVTATNSTVPTDALSQHIQVIFYTELSRAELVFGFDARAERSLAIAQKASQFEFAISGVKGKRTKYQEREITQLVLLAKSKHDKEVSSDAHDDSFDSLPPPIALELNSDLLLEKIKYNKIDGDNKHEISDYESLPETLRSLDPNNQPTLQDIDSAIVLLKLLYIKETTAHNNPLTQEELKAIVNRLIESAEGSVNWCIYSRALWERSLLEATSAKTVERGALQMQSLVEELGQNSTTYIAHDGNSKDQIENLPERLSYVHQLVPLPKWAMDAKLGERFLSLGSLKSALDVFERLEMWHHVALCYASVGQEQKAIELLKDHLETHPKDARAWSILGDISEKTEYWEKAWEVGKYPGARRSIAKYYYNPPKTAGIARDLNLAIKYMNDALKMNPLHYHTWFLYGCAGLETEQFDLAAEAFTRCVSIEEDDGKSWSNLATAQLRMGKRAEAFSALKRAVALTAEKKNWKMWTNYVTVALDLENWVEVLRGTRELLTIPGSNNEAALEVNILEQLCQILIRTEYPTEGYGRESGSPKRLDFFQRSAITLFTETLPPLITNIPRLWKIVARVELWRGRPWATLDCYEKGFRIYTHMPEVESDEKVWKDAVEFCCDLVDAYINLGIQEGRHGDGSLVCSNWKFKSRSAIRVLVGKGKKWWEGTPGLERLQQVYVTLD